MTARRNAQILAALTLANLISYAARNELFTVYKALRIHYSIDNAQIGLLQTVFIIPHAAATLLYGWAGDRYDRRRVIAVGLLIASIAGAAGAFGASYVGLAISRAWLGFGTAAIVPVASSLLSQIYEGPHKASRLSIFNLGLFLGGAAGYIAGTALDFPLVVVALAVPGLVLAVWILVLPVPARRGPVGEAAPGWRQFAAQFIRDARVLLAIRSLRWVIVSATAMAFTTGAYGAWLKDFLVQDKRMDDAEATALLVVAGFGGLAGVVVGGRIGDRLRARRPTGRLWTIVVGMALTIPFASLSLELPAGPWLYATGIATMFFITWYHAPIAASIDDLAPASLSVSAQGLVIFTMHILGTATSSWLVGEVSERTSLGTAMWVPTAALAVAAVAMALATPRFAADHQRARSAHQ